MHPYTSRGMDLCIDNSSSSEKTSLHFSGQEERNIASNTAPGSVRAQPSQLSCQTAASLGALESKTSHRVSCSVT